MYEILWLSRIKMKGIRFGGVMFYLASIFPSLKAVGPVGKVVLCIKSGDRDEIHWPKFPVLLRSKVERKAKWMEVIRKLHH